MYEGLGRVIDLQIPYMPWQRAGSNVVILASAAREEERVSLRGCALGANDRVKAFAWRAGAAVGEIVAHHKSPSSWYRHTLSTFVEVSFRGNATSISHG